MVKCKGKTATGKPCSRNVTDGLYCFQHNKAGGEKKITVKKSTTKKTSSKKSKPLTGYFVEIYTKGSQDESESSVKFLKRHHINYVEYDIENSNNKSQYLEDLKNHKVFSNVYPIVFVTKPTDKKPLYIGHESDLYKFVRENKV